jgi:hypothetical protein
MTQYIFFLISLKKFGFFDFSRIFFGANKNIMAEKKNIIGELEGGGSVQPKL